MPGLKHEEVVCYFYIQSKNDSFDSLQLSVKVILISVPVKISG